MVAFFLLEMFLLSRQQTSVIPRKDENELSLPSWLQHSRHATHAAPELPVPWGHCVRSLILVSLYMSCVLNPGSSSFFYLFSSFYFSINHISYWITFNECCEQRQVRAEESRGSVASASASSSPASRCRPSPPGRWQYRSPAFLRGVHPVNPPIF